MRHHLEQHAILCITIFLILLTVLFELFKHWIESTVPPAMRVVVVALFGELTVLGLLGLCAFGLEHAGVLRLLGKALFSGLEESEGGLEELFERVHFGMFFILLIFLLQTCILVYELRNVVIGWFTLSSRQGHWATACREIRLAYEMRAGTPGGGGWLRRQLRRPLGAYRVARLREELRYFLLTERFAAPPDPPRDRLSERLPAAHLPDALAAYLRHRAAQTAARLLQLSVPFWLCAGSLLVLAFEGFYLVEILPRGQETLARDAAVEVSGIAVLAWLMLAAFAALAARLRWMVDQLTPQHPLLHAHDGEGDGDVRFDTVGDRSVSTWAAAGTEGHRDGTAADEPRPDPDEQRPDPALIRAPLPYQTRAALRGVPARVLSLYPGAACLPRDEKRAERLLVFLVRLLLFLTAVLFAAACREVLGRPRWPALLALLPLLGIISYAPRALLPPLVVITSVEDLRNTRHVKRAVVDVKVNLMLRLMRTLAVALRVMRAAGRLAGPAVLRRAQAEALQAGLLPRAGGDEGTLPALSARQLQELRLVFELLARGAGFAHSPRGSPAPTPGASRRNSELRRSPLSGRDPREPLEEHLSTALPRPGAVAGIEAEQLEQALHQLLPARDRPEAAREARSLFKAICPAGERAISLDVFTAWLVEHGYAVAELALRPEDVVKQIFDMYFEPSDAEHVGEIASDHVRWVFEHIGADLRGAEVDAALLLLDDNGDTNVSTREFLRLFKLMDIQPVCKQAHAQRAAILAEPRRRAVGHASPPPLGPARSTVDNVKTFM